MNSPERSLQDQSVRSKPRSIAMTTPSNLSIKDQMLWEVDSCAAHSAALLLAECCDRMTGGLDVIAIDSAARSNHHASDRCQDQGCFQGRPFFHCRFLHPAQATQIEAHLSIAAIQVPLALSKYKNLSAQLPPIMTRAQQNISLALLASSVSDPDSLRLSTTY